MFPQAQQDMASGREHLKQTKSGANGANSLMKSFVPRRKNQRLYPWIKNSTSN
jgi:hypothetical protein